ncbi:MAG: SEC-C domain-containing protein [Deltaproteobacteria bacterium]|nr:SEC-C domain-containing protein [Deltaproteobacteria bacterium]
MSDADYEERLKSTGRNESCPCGSGKKYKKCHLAEDEGKRSAARKALAEEVKARAAKKAEEEEEEADESTTTAGKQSKQRQRSKAGSKAQQTDGKPRNIPRRGAV